MANRNNSHQHYQFVVPETLAEAEQRRTDLVNDIRDIDLQLSNKTVMVQ